jgi:hydroxymethylglutaryl-CoA reductase (NADPH)
MSEARHVRPARTSSAPQHEALVREIVDRRRGLHKLPPELSADQAAAVRREALAQMATTEGERELHHIGNYSLDSGRAATRNCENFIGVAQVPMGVAGPLAIRGDYVNGEVYVPMATTEGALIASVNRGCAAIRRAGGAVVYAEDVGMTRAPAFRTSGIEESRAFLRWIAEHEDEIRQGAEGESQYLRLQEIRPYTVGSTVFLRFRFHSGDAMGMNMATIACDRVVEKIIEPQTGVRCVALSGNYCVDKKAAAVNFQEGRGKRIHAEILVPQPVLEGVLKSNAAGLAEVSYRKNLLGSIAAGAMGFNAQVANVLAALFCATGQDLAHVVEGSMGIACFEEREEGAALASVYLPDVPLGAVGGGTGLDTQREALSMMGVRLDPARPGAAVMRLAEIAGGIVLAGELSLMAAFTSRDLAGAHERLGRGGPP